MAEFVDRFNCIALVERLEGCRNATTQGSSQTSFRIIYISVIEGGRIVLSLMMGDSLGQVFFPPRFYNVFSTADLYRLMTIG